MTAPVCSIAPTAPAATASCGGRPKTEVVPASGSRSPSSMSIVVDLPAPLGPSRATVCPRSIVTSIPRTAWTGPRGLPKDFVSPWISMLSSGGTLPKLAASRGQPRRENELARGLERGRDGAEHDRVGAELALLDPRLERRELGEALFETRPQQ